MTNKPARDRKPKQPRGAGEADPRWVTASDILFELAMGVGLTQKEAKAEVRKALDERE